MKNVLRKPRISYLDIETCPMKVYAYHLYDVNVSLNQIQEEWVVLSWAMMTDDKIDYRDVRINLTGKVKKQIKDLEKLGHFSVMPRFSDREILKDLHAKLFDVDVLVTHNGKRFDIKKLNARFAYYGFKPIPESIVHIDTLQIAKKRFAFTSNKLEYLAKFLGCENKKLTARKFNGQELWNECLKNNFEAFDEMERYNKLDVIVLKDVHNKLEPWNTQSITGSFTDVSSCSCGSNKFIKNGFRYTPVGKFQRYFCSKCGKEHKGRENHASETFKKREIK